MRPALLLSACLLTTAALTACADDPEPTASGTPTPRPSATVTATSSGTATPTGTATGAPAAAPATSASASASATGTAAPAAPVASPATASVRLTGNGIDLGRQVVAFGATHDSARPALDAALGRPTTDTGVIESFGPYGTCPGTQLRALEYAGGALVVLFGDVDGPGLTMYQWGLTPEGSPSRAPRASALVGDTATYEFGVGTTVAELRQGAQPAQVDVSPGDEAFPASFRLADQSPGFFGYLTGASPDDTATFVQGGEGCGE